MTTATAQQKALHKQACEGDALAMLALADLHEEGDEQGEAACWREAACHYRLLLHAFYGPATTERESRHRRGEWMYMPAVWRTYDYVMRPAASQEPAGAYYDGLMLPGETWMSVRHARQRIEVRFCRICRRDRPARYARMTLSRGVLERDGKAYLARRCVGLSER